MQKRLVGLLLAMVGLVVLVGCGGGESDSGDDVLQTDVVWQWIEFQDTAETNDISVPNPENYSIVFYEVGEIAAVADCNGIGGEYEQIGNSLQITLGAGTLVFCGEESLDEQFKQYLSNTASFVYDDEGHLVLNLEADAGNLVFQNGGAAPTR